jgi:chromosome segregation ATPase
LLLAASELSAFRAAAQVERDRLGQVAEAAKAQTHALQAQLEERERVHAAQVAQLRELVESQMAQRESAWAGFSEGLQQRLANLAAAQAQHEADMEEQSSLRRQLHAARAQLESSHQTQFELEKRLSASEEAFALAAGELQKTRDDVVLLTEQCAEVSRELSATAALCAQLQVERRLMDTKLGEAEGQRTRLEGELGSLASQLRDLRMERDELLGRAAELKALLEKHTALEAEAGRLLQTVQAQQLRIDELTRASRELDSLRAQHAGLQAHAEEQRQTLQHQQGRLEELTRASHELEALRGLLGEVELRVETLRDELATEKTRAKDLERVREELHDVQVELSRAQRERDELRGEYAQAQAARNLLEPLRDEVARLRSAYAKLEARHGETRAQLDTASQAAADANAEKEAAEWRLAETRKLEATARARVKDAEADVAAARRERDQVRASVESRQSELADLEQRLADQRAEFDELTQTRWTMLDNEKQRSAKLKAELEQARAELSRLRGVGGTERPPMMRPTPVVSSSEAPEEAIEDYEMLDFEDEVRARVDSLGPIPAKSIDAGLGAVLQGQNPQAKTLPPRQPANDVTSDALPVRPGSTAYSVTEVEPEDVFGTGSMPRPGRSEGGGRGGR